jgi:hypothetical protein
MKQAYYAGTITNFLQTLPETILGHLITPSSFVAVSLIHLMPSRFEHTSRRLKLAS